MQNFKYPNLPLDTDTSDALLAPGRPRYRLNCRVGKGRVENAFGTVQVEFTLPAGENVCKGTIEDLKGESMVFFVWNSQNNHSIFRYFAASGAVELILQWSGLNFRADKPVFGSVVDDLCYFTDGYWTPTQWNEPRKLNLTRKILYDSIKAAEPYFANRLRRPPAFPPLAVRTQVSGTAYNSGTVYSKGNTAVVTAVYPDSGIEYKDLYEFINETPTAGILVTNAAFWRKKNDDYAKLGAFQFAVRYVYNDFEKSVLSPYSALVSHPANGESNTKFIRVSLPPNEVSRLSKEVDRIDFFVRNGNVGDFALTHKIRRADDGTIATSFDFYNPRYGEVLTPAEQSRISDAVPITSNDNVIARDRLFDGGYREGYDVARVALSASYGMVTEGGSSNVQTGRPAWQLQTDSGDALFPNTTYYAAATDGLYYVIGSKTYITNVGYSSEGFTAQSGQTTASVADGAVGSTFATLNAMGNFTTVFNWPPLTVTFLGVSDSPGAAPPSVSKSFSQYKVGIVFFDYGGRNNGVFTSDALIITSNARDQTNQLGFKFALNPAELNIPIWATHYALVMSRNLTMSSFFQAVMADSYYVDNYDKTTDTYTYTRTQKFRGHHIDISNLPSAGMGYVFEAGDRIRAYVSATEIYDNAIASQRGDILILEGFGFPMPDAAIKEYVYEIYTPYQPSLEEPFFEVGLTYPIAGAGTPARSYSVASGNLPGDTFVASRKFKKYDPLAYTLNGTNAFDIDADGFSAPALEVMNPWTKFSGTWYTSAGRAFADVDSKQVYKARNVRFSDKYVSGTRINGLSTFQALNDKPLPVEVGTLCRLVLASNVQAVGSVLLAVGAHETISMYLSEAQFRDNQGQTLVAISGEVIGAINDLRGGLGSTHPQSIVTDGQGRVYGWCGHKREPWRYSADGMTPLATVYQMQNHFRTYWESVKDFWPQMRVCGGYDYSNKEYYLSFAHVADSVVTQGMSIGFSEEEKGFVSQYDYFPECFGKVSTQLFCFSAGMHAYAPALRNTFFGLAKVSKIGLCANQPVSRMKVWTSVAIEGDSLWVPTQLTNEEGQESLMKAAWFDNREGVYYGAIRRDVNSRDSQGRKFDPVPAINEIKALNFGAPMRSQTLNLELTLSQTTPARLDFINVFSIDSHNALV